MHKKNWEEFQERVECIDEMAQWALGRHNQKISEKYTNIQNTIKILNSMIQDFGKKADIFEVNIKGKTRIQELQYQKEYYEKRIKECCQLAEKLKVDLQNKKNQISFVEEETEELKKALIIAKTNNIKNIMKLEDIEKKTKIREKKQEMMMERQLKRSKKNYERNLLLTNNYQEQDPLKSFYTQNQYIQKALFTKIDSNIKLKNIIKESYELLKEKLKTHQKRSKSSGLAGSLFFRLENEKNRIYAKNKDPKLIIYDILKQKYNKVKKQEKKKLQKFYIEEEQFMNFSPLQILGVIELKGGLKALNKNFIHPVQNKQNVK